jgi:hypothetical protein
MDCDMHIEELTPIKDVYLDRVSKEVEELASRVAVLKGRFAKQKFSAKLEHYWELDYLRIRFAEFKWKVEALEEADDLQIERAQVAVQVAWKELTQAIDVLLREIPETVESCESAM